MGVCLLPLVNVKALSRERLSSFLSSIGQPDFRAAQLFAWVHGRGMRSFDDMTDLPLGLRAELSRLAYIGCLVTRVCLASKQDGTEKYVFELDDGELVESVALAHEYGRSACVASQVGCRMGCTFCASTIGGLVRNLHPWEMEDQVLAMSPSGVGGTTQSRRISSVVVMGSGEPLENLDSVCEFVERIHDPLGLGIGLRHVTVSTCGLPNRMVELAERLPQVTLAVSLHAPNDELRSRLMPVNRRYCLSSVLEACRQCVALTGRRISFEYALIEGVNDGLESASQLTELLRGLLCHVNLIPLNPVTEREYRASSRDRVDAFRAVLASAGVPATVRRELGRDIDAACGQLRRRAIEQHGL